MAEEVGRYDPEVELIEVSVNLFLASAALEEDQKGPYLDYLRRAQAHLTGLILDAEEHATVG
ncbi:MAG: hypothetical protein JRN59_05340 [Nitrososphaerota archaeon]|nr:hypothetical protein [Nitrososphaerota archaeon]